MKCLSVKVFTAGAVKQRTDRLSHRFIYFCLHARTTTFIPYKLENNMALARMVSKYLTLFLLATFTVKATSAVARNSRAGKKKREEHSLKSKLKIDHGSFWPFLPAPGSHYTASKGYPSYPFMILSPPGKTYCRRILYLH